MITLEKFETKNSANINGNLNNVFQVIFNDGSKQNFDDLNTLLDKFQRVIIERETSHLTEKIRLLEDNLSSLRKSNTLFESQILFLSNQINTLEEEKKRVENDIIQIISHFENYDSNDDDYTELLQAFLNGETEKLLNKLDDKSLYKEKEKLEKGKINLFQKFRLKALVLLKEKDIIGYEKNIIEAFNIYKEFDTAFEIVTFFIEQHNLADAQKYCNEAILLASDDYKKGICFDRLASICEKNNDYKSASIYYQESLKLLNNFLELVKDDKIDIEIQISMTQANYGEFLTGQLQYELARDLVLDTIKKQTLLIELNQNLLINLTQSYNSLALIYRFLGEFNLSEEIYQLAINNIKTLLVELTDEDIKDNILCIYSGMLNNLGEYYRSVGKPKEALPLLKESISIEEKLYYSNPSAHAMHIAQSYGNYALALMKHNQTIQKDVEYFLQKSIKIYEALITENFNYYGGQYAIFKTSLGAYYLKIKSYESSKKHLFESKNSFEKIILINSEKYSYYYTGCILNLATLSLSYKIGDLSFDKLMEIAIKICFNTNNYILPIFQNRIKDILYILRDKGLNQDECITYVIKLKNL